LTADSLSASFGEGQGEVSNSIHIQSTASRSRGIAFDIEEIGIYIKEIAADSRETAINWTEIGIYIKEIAANIGEIRIYPRRTAARSRGMAANSLFPAISA
jgi:methyl-accepting chemotaxis protein